MPAILSSISKHLPKINVAAYLLLVIMNVIAMQCPIFGKTPKEVSDLFPNLLTPADFSFSVWSIIYILLGFFTWYQAKPLYKKGAELDVETRTLGLWFLVSCLLNIAWLFAWELLQIPLSFIVLFLLWLLLIYINYLLTMLDGAKKWYTIPFSLYLGWICISTLGNLNILLIFLDYDFFGFSEEIWTSGLIIVGILGTLLVLYLNGDVVFTAVLIWALYGMFWKNKQLSPSGNLVSDTALFAMIFLGFSALFSWIRRRKQLNFD